MARFITLQYQPKISGVMSHLPASKSISNRVLVIRALSQGRAPIKNLSEANDTRLMQKLITSSESVIDAEDAGTTMRFLTAYFAITGSQKLLTGTERMKQRPIRLLVDSLRKLGADIVYTENEGFPPLKIQGAFIQKTSRIAIRGDVSSQFISALLLVAPALPQGLTLELERKISSRPYIDMTLALMRSFGSNPHCIENRIEVPPGSYQSVPYTVEPDWSAASYWFAFVALAKDAELVLPGVTLKSVQGDRVIVDIMEQLGVKAEPRGNDLLIASKEYRPEFSWDFTGCPDLVQTVAVVCAARGINATFTGLESLKLKETDRTKALQVELAKLGATFTNAGEAWHLTSTQKLPDQIPPIHTYLDHRMAMAFAPLCMMRNVQIENPEVVKKSYPHFWRDVQSAGITSVEE
ncbi:3-phosphoshikimate 1-carboxyvinyltransferase [Oscillatoria amoena NRMC-F 0135]|nr:3-phosphoshikimate 1-carboxyvinyltransferase [Oscillatoria amoena NRMC-F 0135]